MAWLIDHGPWLSLVLETFMIRLILDRRAGCSLAINARASDDSRKHRLRIVRLLDVYSDERARVSLIAWVVEPPMRARPGLYQ